MFVPPLYREPDASWLADLIRANPLALLVTNGADGPLATHLPVIPDPGMTGEWPADLSGVLLLGHLDRGNPHWAALADGDAALLAFTGPHAYVSPSVYRKTPSAPTWDYTAVHVRGVLERIDTPDETLAVLRATVLALEARIGTGWDMAASLDYFRGIAPGVGAFRMVVTAAEGMFRLSQEQPVEIRDRVLRSFEGSGDPARREVAELMRRMP